MERAYIRCAILGRRDTPNVLFALELEVEFCWFEASFCFAALSLFFFCCLIFFFALPFSFGPFAAPLPWNVHTIRYKVLGRQTLPTYCSHRKRKSSCSGSRRRSCSLPYSASHLSLRQWLGTYTRQIWSPLEERQAIVPVLLAASKLGLAVLFRLMSR